MISFLASIRTKIILVAGILFALVSFTNCSKQGSEGQPGTLSAVAITNAVCQADGSVSLTLTNSEAYPAEIPFQFSNTQFDSDGDEIFGFSGNYSIACISGNMQWRLPDTATPIILPTNNATTVNLNTCNIQPCNATGGTVLSCTIYAFAPAPNVFDVTKQQIQCS